MSVSTLSRFAKEAKKKKKPPPLFSDFSVLLDVRACVRLAGFLLHNTSQF